MSEKDLIKVSFSHSPIYERIFQFPKEIVLCLRFLEALPHYWKQIRNSSSFLVGKLYSGKQVLLIGKRQARRRLALQVLKLPFTHRKEVRLWVYYCPLELDSLFSDFLSAPAGKEATFIRG